MRARSKYVAVVDFSACGKSFRAGDSVPPSLALEAALLHGDLFVKADTKRSPAASADPTTPTASAASPEE